MARSGGLLLALVLASLALSSFCLLPPASAASRFDDEGDEDGRARYHPLDEDEDDFAEFDEDEDEPKKMGKKPKAKAPPAPASAPYETEPFDDEFEDVEDEATVEEEGGMEDEEEEYEDEEEEEVERASMDDDEFAHFNDDEEFEGYKTPEQAKPRGPPPKDIKVVDVPKHLHNNWENYYLEMLMAGGIIVYFLNFFIGKSKNQRLAQAWFNAHKAMLESNFALVGDDGAKDKDDIETQLVKDAEHLFTLWCSGRVCCEGMLVELKLLKRQDLVAIISNIMKPAYDQVQVKVHMNPDDMDTFVFCLANKKAAAKLAKEMSDINTFCPERRPAEKYGVPAQFCIMCESAEVSTAMLDPKMAAMLNKYPDSIDSIHFSDQYTGLKPPEDQAPEVLPEGKKTLIFTFNINLKKMQFDEAVEEMKPLMLLVFYFMERVKRFKLTREAKNKAEKNRTKVAEVYWKSIHATRADKAQEERERKRREVKERIKEIEDPEKQRKMEERENRKDKKKAQPKMKQLKVKAM